MVLKCNEIIFIIMFTCSTGLAVLRTVDVGPILDLDLTLYQLTYDKNKGQSIKDFPEKDGFSASQVEMRGMETAERMGQAYIAVDGPLYRMAYGLQMPNLEFTFGELQLPELGVFNNVTVTSSVNNMNRFLENTPLKNGRCIVRDGVIWTNLEQVELHVDGQPPKDVTEFFNTTFKECLNSMSVYYFSNKNLEKGQCKEFTTPFTTVFV